MFKKVLPIIALILSFLLTIKIAEEFMLWYFILDPLGLLIGYLFPQIYQNTASTLYQIICSRWFLILLSVLSWFIIGSLLDLVIKVIKRNTPDEPEQE